MNKPDDDCREAREALQPLIDQGLAEIIFDDDGVEMVRLTEAGRKHAEEKWPGIILKKEAG